MARLGELERQGFLEGYDVPRVDDEGTINRDLRNATKRVQHRFTVAGEF